MNRVPRTFPGTMGLRCGEEELLHPQYRRYDSAESEEFLYFLTRVLSAVNAKAKSEFENKKSILLISDIYTTSDEAFALLVLYNEAHVWKQQYDFEARRSNDTTTNGNTKRKAPRYAKRFCDARSGNKQGWSEEGQNVFNALCREVDRRRAEPASKDLEEKIRAKFVLESNKRHGRLNKNAEIGESQNSAVRTQNAHYITPNSDLFKRFGSKEGDTAANSDVWKMFGSKEGDTAAC